MKKTMTFFGIIVVAFGLCYLLGAFGHANFDITQWDSEKRLEFAFGAGAVSLCVGLAWLWINFYDCEGSTDDSIQG